MIFPQYRFLTHPAAGELRWTSNQYLYSSQFYDDRARLIQSQTINYTGAIDTLKMQYNINGALLRTLLNHKKNGNTVQAHTVLTKMDYDHRFRIGHTWKKIDGAASDQLIDSIQYNELGQLRAKYIGNKIDTVIYDYKISWRSRLIEHAKAHHPCPGAKSTKTANHHR